VPENGLSLSCSCVFPVDAVYGYYMPSGIIRVSSVKITMPTKTKTAKKPASTSQEAVPDNIIEKLKCPPDSRRIEVKG